MGSEDASAKAFPVERENIVSILQGTDEPSYEISQAVYNCGHTYPWNTKWSWNKCWERLMGWSVDGEPVL